MSYEYKDEIIMNLKDYNAGRKVTGGTHAFEYKLEELDEVYAQAAKADEYEAKAEAYDDIRYAMEMQTAIGVSDEDTLIDIEHVIMRLIERMGSGGSDD